MFEGGPGSLAVVLEYQNIPEPEIPFEIDDPVSVGMEYLREVSVVDGGEGIVMVGRLDDDLMSADAVHPVKKPPHPPAQVHPRHEGPDTCWGQP